MQGNPPDRFRDHTLTAFIERLSSAEPVPGGGSASAVAASLGAALVTMVASLSEGRPAYAEHVALHDAARTTGSRLVDRFLELADEDAAAYGAFAAALKLPKASPDDVAARSAAMSEAARLAADVPLECLVACRELVETAESLAGRSNRNAASDLNVAALLGEAAARGAAANVLVNLPSVADPAYVAEATERVDALLHDIGRLADLTRATVLSGERRAALAQSAATGG